MVYFNCGSCGTGLRKNQIEQHMYGSCRSRMYSCIDCLKDFRNDEYKSHVKCLTESERYESKTNFVAKANKGEVKQNAWFEKVLKAVESFKGSAKAKSLLEKMTDYPNVPRKKAKFFNFTRNSFRSYSVTDSMLEEIWSVIESFDKAEKTANSNNNNQNKQTNSNSANLKRKLDQIEEENENSNKKQQVKEESAENVDKFDWLEALKKECCKNDQNQISLSKLEKKIYKKYKNFKNQENEDENSFEKFQKKLNKKLKKLDTSFSQFETDKSEKFVKCLLTS